MRSALRLLEVLPLDDAAGPDLGHAGDERLDQRVVRRDRAAAARDARGRAGRPAAPGCRSRRRARPAGSGPGGCRYAAVYSASLPIGIAIPPAPWSPRPRIRSLSVTTMSRTSSYGPWRSSDGIRSTSAGRDPGAAGPPDDVAELLARPPDRRRVDDRQELLEVLGEEPVEQGRVAVLERGQPDVRARARRPCRRRCSSSRSTCSSMVRTRSGSRPRSRNALAFLRR